MSSLLPFIVSERARVTERPSSGLQAKVTILHCINYAIQEAASVLGSAEISEQVSSSLRVISRRAAFINFVFPSRSKEKFWERTDESRAFARLSILDWVNLLEWEQRSREDLFSCGIYAWRSYEFPARRVETSAIHGWKFILKSFCLVACLQIHEQKSLPTKINPCNEFFYCISFLTFFFYRCLKHDGNSNMFELEFNIIILNLYKYLIYI